MFTCHFFKRALRGLSGSDQQQSSLQRKYFLSSFRWADTLLLLQLYKEAVLLLGQTGLLCNMTPPHAPPHTDSAQQTGVKRVSNTALSSHFTTLHRLLPWPTNFNHHQPCPLKWTGFKFMSFAPTQVWNVTPSPAPPAPHAESTQQSALECENDIYFRQRQIFMKVSDSIFHHLEVHHTIVPLIPLSR